jgi:hypothetical protein
MSGVVFMDRIMSLIVGVSMNDRGIKLTLATGSTVEVWDDAQQCCEHRYATCDDDIMSVIGGTLVDVVLKDARELPGGDTHEAQFVDIVTTKGTLTMCSHNEHNGYYGGFDLVLTLTNKDGVCAMFKARDGGNWEMEEE